MCDQVGRPLYRGAGGRSPGYLLFGDDVRRRLLTPSESLNRFSASAVYTAVLGQPSNARLPASVIFTRSTLRRSPSVLNVSVTTVASPASTSIASMSRENPWP